MILSLFLFLFNQKLFFYNLKFDNNFLLCTKNIKDELKTQNNDVKIKKCIYS